jgi:hypothetical protein
MAQVGHRRLPEGALGLLQEEGVVSEDREHRAKVTQMLGLAAVVDQNIVEKHKYKVA